MPAIRSVPFDLLDRPRNLRFDVNALADLEERAKAGIGTIFSEERAGFNSVRLALWAGLKHEERTLNPDRVGELIGEFLTGGGDLQEIMSVVTDAINASGLFKVEVAREGDEGEGEKKEGDQKPPNPKGAETT